ncbi:MAG: serine/threonine transporter SstT, partial [Candidatus Methanomethylophilaceae archaeon]|nr:serine/threonine transporter SstT [Candidatus Methanomethylophilaceae archaeon]
MGIKQVYDKWESISLVYRIIGGLLIGLVLALIVPGNDYIPILGSLFIGALKAIAPFLVLFLVIGSLSKSGKGIGPLFRLVIIMYVVSTIISAIIATLISFGFPADIALVVPPESTSGSPDSAYDLISGLLMKLVCNPLEALMTGNYLGILFWAVIVGIILRTTASEGTLKMCEDVSDTLVKVIRGIISFAPFGILGLIYESVSTNGMDIFVDYGHLILLLVSAMLIVMFITNPLIVFITTRRNPYPLLFACIKGSAITAFFTRSSAANIPMNLSLCEKMGIDKELYSTSIPLGATINMNGAAITINVMTLAAAYTLGVDVPIYMAILLCIVSSCAACGASGVGGGSLLLIPLACSLLGIDDTIATQLIAIGFVIAVIQD